MGLSLPIAKSRNRKPRRSLSGVFVVVYMDNCYLSLPIGIIAYAVLKCNIRNKDFKKK